MTLSDSTRAVVLKYFDAWQRGHAGELRACLIEQPRFFGGHGFADADQYAARCAQQPRWTDVRLLSTVVEGGEAALFYEGTDAQNGLRVRVAEHVTVVAGKIAELRGVFAADVPEL
jgi:hypothetical protein